jgi:DNA-binding PadR family transcriptional regulator
MARARRPSPQTEKVLGALAVDPAVWRYGYELGLEVGLQSGSLYPILVRLRDRGLLDAKWEEASAAGRPPRHLYRLTEEGFEQATALARPVGKRHARHRPELRGAS